MKEIWIKLELYFESYEFSKKFSRLFLNFSKFLMNFKGFSRIKNKFLKI